jgi:hypothetical protein
VKRRSKTIDAVAVGADDVLWRRLVGAGRAAYRVEARSATRLRTRLQSAKILDSSGVFLCEAAIQDQSKSGFRLLLARDCGLPARFGVYVDLTGEVITAAQAWRRERVVGARILFHAPPSPLKASDHAALGGKYYAVPN